MNKMKDLKFGGFSCCFFLFLCVCRSMFIVNADEKTEISNIRGQIDLLNKKLWLLAKILTADDRTMMTMTSLGSFSGGQNEVTKIFGQINQNAETSEGATNSPGGHQKSCSQVDKSLTSQSRHRTTIYPNGGNEPGVDVMCDMKTEDGGWTLIQRRSSGPKEEFYRNWTEYEEGFGSVDGNFWLGLKTIHVLTKDWDQELRIDLWDFEGDTAYALYSNFSVADASRFYQLSIAGFSGTAGDSMTSGKENLNGMRFTTKDKDDDYYNDENCAQEFRGAWWYRSCTQANLNGFYYEERETPKPKFSGITWRVWKNSSDSLRQVEMKIRPRKN